MGGCASTPTILEKNDGDQAAYAARFKEDRVLGEGEFGQVKLVYEKSSGEEAPRKSYACKTLRKGAVFKDNTLYPAIPPEILQGEIDILRALGGEHYCMKLVAIYETPKALLMITDCYTGGEMMEYISKLKDDLRTEDISRYAFQLLDAVNHCAKNSIIHRDIKPENVMFENEAPGAEMRLIDFGCSTNKVVEGLHTTFAGTPFYNSPEMFQKTYSSRTDVWSAGVLLYVIVAGYPSDNLQKAFNKLLDVKRTSTKDLVNMPQDMPDSYYELLDVLLTYRHKQRKPAEEALKLDFVVFHNDLIEEAEEAEDEVSESLEKPSTRKSRMMRTPSMAVLGSVRRHSAFLDFKKFERSITACMAAMLDSEEFVKLLDILQKRTSGDSKSPQQKLEVVLVKQLKEILKDDIGNSACYGIINGMENSSSYDSFAYHTELLNDFAPDTTEKKSTAPANRNDSLERKASVWQQKSSSKKSPAELEDGFSIATSFHGKVPTNKPAARRSSTRTARPANRGMAITRAQSYAIH